MLKFSGMSIWSRKVAMQEQELQCIDTSIKTFFKKLSKTEVCTRWWVCKRVISWSENLEWKTFVLPICCWNERECSVQWCFSALWCSSLAGRTLFSNIFLQILSSFFLLWFLGFFAECSGVLGLFGAACWWGEQLPDLWNCFHRIYGSVCFKWIRPWNFRNVFSWRVMGTLVLALNWILVVFTVFFSDRETTFYQISQILHFSLFYIFDNIEWF